MIPKQFQNPDFRFVLVRPLQKRAFEFDWQHTRNYVWNDPKLIEHLKDGGNYGVVGGPGNLMLIDLDIMEGFEDAVNKLGTTFTVRTGSGKQHRYYICPDAQNHDFEKNGLHFGELRAIGRYVVGPGSIHPDTQMPYIVLIDAPIREISWQMVDNHLCDYLKPKQEHTNQPIKPISAELARKDEFLQYCLTHTIPEEADGRHAILFRNLASLLVHAGLPDAEIESLGRRVVANCPGRTWTMFKSWINTVRKTGYPYRKGELVNWFEKYEDVLQ